MMFLASLFSGGIIKTILGAVTDYMQAKADREVGLAKEKTLRVVGELQARAAIVEEQRKAQDVEPKMMKYPKLLIYWTVSVYVACLGINQLLSEPLGWKWTIHTVEMWDYTVYAVIGSMTLNGGIYTYNRMKR